MRLASGVTDQYIYFEAKDPSSGVLLTGLSSFTVYRSRNGGAAAAFTTPTINETDSSNMPGVYELLMDEDMTIDSGDETQEMIVSITQASMQPVRRVIELYRPKITAGETLTVSSGAVSTVTTTTTATNVTTVNGLAAGVITAASIATGAIDADALAADAAAEIADAVWDEAQADHVAAGSFGVMASEIADILVDTAEIGAAGAGLTAVPWNAAWDAEVQSEVADALAIYDPPTNTEMTSAFTEIKGATWATTDTLEAIRDRGDAAWITATGFSTLDAAGVRTAVGLASANLDTQLGTLATSSALATVDTVVDAIKAKTDSLTFTVAGQVDANIQYVNDVQVTGDGQTGTEWGP